MADENKVELDGEFANADSIKRLWQRIKQTFVRQDGNKVLSDNNFSDADKEKLDGIEEHANNYSLPTASDQVLGGIKIGAGLSVAQDGTVSVESAGAVEWQDVKHTPTTLEGYGIEDAATKDELEEVRQEVRKIYNYKRSLDTYAELLEIQNPHEGDVYNVKETGANYRWTKEGNEYFWDNLGETFVIDPLTEHDIDVITGYASDASVLNELLEEGGEIELGADLTVSGQKTITNDVVIDLNGFALDSDLPKSEKKEVFIVDGAKLTFKGVGSIEANYRIANAVNGGVIEIDGGDFDAGDVGMTARGAGSKIIMNGGYLTAVEGGFGAFDGAEIVMNDGVIECSDNFPLFTNGTAGMGGNTITVNGGTLVGKIESPEYEACGVYIANNDTFIMNGGEIVANNGCGICMRAGHAVINAGMVACSGEPGTKGKIGDSPIMMGKSAVIYHESANYPGKAGMKLEIKGGTFIGVDHAVEVLSNEATPNVIVTGGSFTPDYPEA